MIENKTDIRLNELDNEGKYLFVYSDKYNIYIFFYYTLEHKLYLITTDKDLIITYIDEIHSSININDYKDIKFFKPYSSNDELIFTGALINDDYSYKFSIRNYKLAVTDKIDYANINHFNLLNCLNNISIINFVQKKNKLYLIGDEVEGNEAIYAIVDIKEDKAIKIYYLYSDIGDITLTSINVDTYNNVVYVSGYITSNNSYIPYLEMFMLC